MQVQRRRWDRVQAAQCIRPSSRGRKLTVVVQADLRIRPGQSVIENVGTSSGQIIHQAEQLLTRNDGVCSGQTERRDEQLLTRCIGGCSGCKQRKTEQCGYGRSRCERRVDDQLMTSISSNLSREAQPDMLPVVTKQGSGSGREELKAGLLSGIECVSGDIEDGSDQDTQQARPSLEEEEIAGNKVDRSGRGS